MRRETVEEDTLEKILNYHADFLAGKPTGEKADPNGANLRWADLR